MSHGLVRLLIACLAVSAASSAAPSAQPDRHQQADVEILISGAPQRRYAHDGRWYVEAVKGREYAIRLRNPFPVRTAVALSVDGLNTINARHTTAADARKWVLGPFETVTISGWQVSQTNARRFEFTSEARSYAQALGQAENLGTISAVFFRERVSTIVRDSANEARESPASPSASPAPESRRDGTLADQERAAKASEDYAATGMGRRTDHAVTQVWLELEDTPGRTVNIRYEFRAQLVRLGILPATSTADLLDRRERARGFASDFAPER
jgi:hypothetical protein